MSHKDKESEKLCCCDLDGIFTDYPECWLKFIEIKIGRYFDSLEKAKKNIPYADYIQLKNDYRSSDFKYNLTPKPASSKFTETLRKMGFFVIIVTRRPATHPLLRLKTINWLQKNDILFDDILFVEKKSDVILEYCKISFFVEDEIDDALMLSKLGYKVFLMENDRVLDKYTHNNISIIKSFEEILNEIKKENQNENIYSK